MGLVEKVERKRLVRTGDRDLREKERKPGQAGVKMKGVAGALSRSTGHDIS